MYPREEPSEKWRILLGASKETTWWDGGEGIRRREERGGEPYGLVVLDLVLGQQPGDLLPDCSGTALLREAEHSIRAPAALDSVSDDILHNSCHVSCSHSLPEPGALHQMRGDGPHLEVVRSHEGVGNPLPHHAHDPLIKVGRRGAR